MLAKITFFLLLIVYTLNSFAKDNYKPLLENRFRLDETIKEVSFIIYRKPNSNSAILIRPDGLKYTKKSKLKEIKWHSDQNIDLVTITKPIPGPWQILGNLVPRNSIKVLSNLQVKLIDFSAPYFVGQRIKFGAKLLLDGKKVTNTNFLKDLRIDVYAKEKGINKSRLLEQDYKHVGKLEDNGEFLDEYAGDGVFTANLDVMIPSGKYQFLLKLHNKTFTRRLSKTIDLLEQPITQKLIQNNKSLIHYKCDAKIIDCSQVEVSTNLIDINGTEHKITRDFIAKNKFQTKINLDYKIYNSMKIKSFAFYPYKNQNIVLNLPVIDIEISGEDLINVQSNKKPSKTTNLKEIIKDLDKNLTSESQSLKANNLMLYSIYILLVGSILGGVLFLLRKKLHKLKIHKKSQAEIFELDE